MSQIVTLHSYRGGTGKSTTVANTALLTAGAGLRVAVVDTDIQTPGLHMFFGMERMESCRSLADYLVGNCEISDAAGLMPTGAPSAAALYVIPARSRLDEVNKILVRGYDIGLLREGFDQLIKDLGLDIVFLDTHSGMGNETAAAVALSTSLLVITRADHLTSEAGQSMSLARRLGHPSTSVIVNMLPEGVPAAQVSARAEQIYRSPVIATLPYCPEIALLGSDGLFAQENPGHEIVAAYQQVTKTVLTG